MLKVLESATRRRRELPEEWTWMLETPTTPVTVQKPHASPTLLKVPSVLNDGSVPGIPEDFAGIISLETFFTVREEEKKQRLVLRFESVAHHCQVFLNGQPAFQNRGGYLPFEGAVNDLVHVGENRLTLRLTNLLDAGTLPAGLFKREEGSTGGFTNDRYFSHPDPMGILGPVFLYNTPWFYIERLSAGSSYSGTRANIVVRAKTVGPFETLLWTLSDARGNSLAQGEGSESRLEISDPHLWLPGAPYCYDLRAETREGETTTDVVTLPLGITGAFEKDFTPQPWPVEQLGLSWTPGAGEKLAAYWAQTGIKTALHLGGFPALPEVLEQADRLGIPLVSGVYPGEVPLWPEDARLEEALELRMATWQAMALGQVQRDAHHPSILAWSLGPFPEEAPVFWQQHAKALGTMVAEADPQNRPVIWH